MKKTPDEIISAAQTSYYQVKREKGKKGTPNKKSKGKEKKGKA